MTELSRSEQKRRFKELETVAADLSLLSENDLSQLPASDAVKGEIAGCRSMKGGARKRQIKYLARVLREEPADEILAYLASRTGSKVKENRLTHEAERLRDLLIDEMLDSQEEARQRRMSFGMDWPGKRLAEVVTALQMDETELRRSLHSYARTRSRNGYREIFRMIKAAVEKKERGY